VSEAPAPAAPEGDLACITPTLAALMRVEPPALCSRPPLRGFLTAANQVLHGGPAERILLHAPDALGCHLLPSHADRLAPVREHAPVTARVRAMVPPVTPVCFASMFTGASPEAHGIQDYRKPVLECDTVFDALLRAGKRVAIAAVEGSSMEVIFRGRELDYRVGADDAEVTRHALALIQEDRHDLLVVYQQEYDDTLHRSGPFSPEALRAVDNHVAAFATLARAADLGWRARSRVVLLCPDHGAHLDPDSGRGTHGLPIPEDLEVDHYLGAAAAEMPATGQT